MSASLPTSSTTWRQPVACSSARLLRATSMGVVVSSPLSTGDLPPWYGCCADANGRKGADEPCIVAIGNWGGSIEPSGRTSRRNRRLGAYGFVPARPLAWHHGRRHSKCLAALRSEEHTSELQSLRHLVCRLLLEKKKNTPHTNIKTQNKKKNKKKLKIKKTK